ncbi:uncharacterized protein N7496_008130 [Penicillium cataractarum]|uniref:Extracellular serine-rich protein n=1 Tax=Penicillium cataractarum TaxID=2100454 RepID=A0A9W9RZ52_9EURO|nr:uncharacterized protein N7496_008130 [Penicillium cataractarum]KAJ5368370.1 hypothetical protein N7496_008130 [Penicillium cataractarum]
MLFARHVLGPLLVSIGLSAGGYAEEYYSSETTAATSSTTLLPASSSSTSTGIATHTVQVGPKSSPQAYVPHNLTANPGDVVVFEFNPTNHSVVKADFDAPCVPASEGVFFSGMMDKFNESNGQVIGPLPTWSIVINDTQPTFFYCTAIGSCLKNGMVGVINPNSTQTFDEQYKKALTYPYMVVPGQSIPAEGGGSSTSSNSSATSAATNGGGGGGLSGGAIAGIVIGAVVFIAVVVVLLFVIGRKRVYSRDEHAERRSLFNSIGSNHDNRRSDLDSNYGRAPGTNFTSVSGPEPMMREFSTAPESASGFGGTSSRPNSGQWNWNNTQQGSRTAQGPTELDVNAAIYELPDSRGP